MENKIKIDYAESVRKMGDRVWEELIKRKEFGKMDCIVDLLESEESIHMKSEEDYKNFQKKLLEILESKERKK